MSILSYQKFLNNQSLLEGLREMKFVLSPRFIKILSSINHTISEELLKLHNDLDSSKRQTFIDVCEDKDEYVTFIQANKASELLSIPDEETYSKIDKNILNNINLSNPVYKQFRTEVRLGRFINNIFGPGKFSDSARYTTEKPSDIESFVRLYKATFNQDEKFELMELVQGEDIAYWYDCNNYKTSDGSLGGSCMSDVNSRYFDIYCDNSSVSLLILYSNTSKNKIEGRALVWKLIEPADRIYMDRIYTNDSSKEELYIEYAKKQGWLYRSIRGYGNGSVVDGKDGSSANLKLVAQLTPNGYYDEYPYMDTMLYYNPNNGKISNREVGMNYILQSTGGYYEEMNETDYEEVYSNYEGSDIYKSEATWCDFGEDWVLTNHAIKVFNTNNRYAVPGHPDIVKSFIPDLIDKHFEKTRCTWSDYLNTWIFNGSVTKVWTDYDRSNYVIDYKKRSGVTFATVDGEEWKIDLVEKVGEEWKLKVNMKTPVNKPKGWHRKIKFIDDDGNVFSRGKFIGNE